MKRILFYTFLAIFVLTALVTLSGLAGILKINEELLKILVIGLLIELAGAVVGLFVRTDFFSQDTAMELIEGEGNNRPDIDTSRQSHAPDEVPIPEVPIPSPEAKVTIASLKAKAFDSPIDFFRVLRALDHRFHERAEFESEANGAAVSWTGYVYDFSEIADRLTLTLVVNADMSGGTFVAFFSTDFKSKILSLQKFDLVRVSGTIRSCGPQVSIIDGESVALEHLEGKPHQ